MLSNEIRNEIISFLNSLEIQHLKFNIARILNPKVEYEELGEDYISNLTLEFHYPYMPHSR